jgi:hypothetical protein
VEAECLPAEATEGEMPVNIEDAPPPDEERLRAAIGPRADYYLRHWREMDAKGKSYDWNWAACLLNVFWFAYRKMWGPMVAMGLVYVVTSPFLDPAHRTAFKIAAVVLVGLSFVTGGLGNRLYRARVARIVADTAGLDDDAARAQAAARGGVSLPAALIAVVGLVVLSALAGMIPALLGRG